MIHIKLHIKRTGKKELDIHAPYADNALPVSMPSRTWNKTTKTWRAPIVRMNVDYLRRNSDKFEATEEAWECMKKCEVTEVRTNAFPSKYPFKLQPMPHQLEALKATYPVRNPGIFMDIGCYSGDTEYLTPTGWRRIDEYVSGEVAQFIPGKWTDDGSIEFVKPLEYIKEPCNEMLHITGKSDQKISLNHRMLLYESSCGVKSVREARHWLGLSPNRMFLVPSVFSLTTGGIPYTENEIRLLVAIQADGRFPKDAPNTTRVCISVKKERKKLRMESLLTGVSHSISSGEFNDYRFYAPIRSKSFGDEFWWEANEEQRLIILDEMQYWDGSSIETKGRTRKTFFHTTDKPSADFIQWCGSSTGKCTTLSAYDRTDEGKPIEYKVYFGNKPHSGVQTKNATVVPTDDGFKYCFVVPSSFLIMRRNGRIFASGNTGKTKVAIDTASCRYLEGSISKVLVVCLVSIKHQWEGEIKLNCPIGTSVMAIQTNKSGKKAFTNFTNEDGFRWAIVGIESLSAGAAYEMCTEFVDNQTMVIIDESDSIKNPSAIRTEKCLEMAEVVKYKMIMTGTPITQGILDLYSQFEFLDPNILGIGSYFAYKQRYAVFNGHNEKQVVGYQRVDEIIEMVSPYIYQVRKRDVLKDLPESSYATRVVDMSKEQTTIYSELKRTLRMKYENKLLTVKSTINLMQRFSEITGGFFSYVDDEAMDLIPDEELASIKYKKEYLKSNPKADELMAFIESLPNDEPVIIWAVAKMEVAYLVKRIGDKYGHDTIVQMHGAISEEDRHKGLAKFSAGKARFLIGNQSVGGIGLNMTVAAIMVYFSNDFSLKRRIQSEGRIERIGQKRPMLYMDFVCRGSIDKYIIDALRNKNDFAETIRRAFDSGMLEEVV